MIKLTSYTYINQDKLQEEDYLHRKVYRTVCCCLKNRRPRDLLSCIMSTRLYEGPARAFKLLITILGNHCGQQRQYRAEETEEGVRCRSR